jgi:hypothetical protein
MDDLLPVVPGLRRSPRRDLSGCSNVSVAFWMGFEDIGSDCSVVDECVERCSGNVLYKLWPR